MRIMIITKKLFDHTCSDPVWTYVRLHGDILGRKYHIQDNNEQRMNYAWTMCLHSTAWLGVASNYNEDEVIQTIGFEAQ